MPIRSAGGPFPYGETDPLYKVASRAATQEKEHEKNGDGNTDQPQKDPANFTRFTGAMH